MASRNLMCYAPLGQMGSPRCSQTRFYENKVCSKDRRFWLGSFVAWAGGVAGVHFIWHLEFFRPLLFSSPVLLTLLVTFVESRGCGCHPSPGRTAFFAIFMFMIYWTIYQAYPVQCRRAWGLSMIRDESYWGNSTAIGLAVVRENTRTFPMQEADPEAWPHMLTRPRNATGALVRTHWTHEPNGNRMYGLLKDGDENATKVGAKWMRAWPRGDTYQNFLLKAYCNEHRLDLQLPHVFPLRVLGISPVEVNLRAPCPFWSCILTEPRSGGKLPFLWILLVPVAANMLHARVVGHLHKWWAWFWMALVPLWTVALIKSSEDIELVTFFLQYKKVFFYTFCVIAVAGALAFYFRDRLRQELGLNECLRFQIPNDQIVGGHTFQVCVWRVDVKAEHEQHEEASTSVMAPQMSGSGWRSMTSGGDGCFVLPAGDTGGFFGWLRRPTMPDQIWVRLCYGNEEIQRTRVQYLTWRDTSYAYRFSEIFTLSLDQRSGAQFKVEIRGKSFVSDVVMDAEHLDRAFERSNFAASQLRLGKGIAEEQILRMRRPARVNHEVAVTEDQRMREVGFYPFPGNNGLQVWLAFCNVDDYEDQVRCC